MTVELSAEMTALLDEHVKTGRFASREQALSQAIRLLGGAPVVDEETIASRKAAFEEVRAIRKQIKLGPDLTVRDLIEDGRR